MPLWEAAVLGLVQGLAEFLPISSSGHLVLFHALFGVEEGALAFDIVLHMGTLVAVLTYFWSDWLRLAKTAITSLYKPDWSNPDVRLLVYLIVATIPGAFFGATLGDMIEEVFHGGNIGPYVVTVTLGLMGAMLLLGERLAKHTRGMADLTWFDALLIGLSQALALVPGVSRSGATMTMGLFLGMKRDDVARFSFLMAAPITAGAGLVKVPDAIAAGNGAIAPMVVGFLVSMLSGFFAIGFLLRYVRARSFKIFGVYRIALAIVLAVVLFT